MAFDPIWQLLLLPVAFALGWLASRLDLRQLRVESRQNPKAVFRGLNYLLNEQQDKAIDAFIEAVQSDPDTSELHFALGNLFRRRGEYQRAVRVHEHLLARGDLKPSDRDNAQYALALDYLKAGLVDHAEAALQRLQGSSLQEQAREALLGLYERTRDWSRALEVAAQLNQTGRAGALAGRMAHFHCERATQARQAGRLQEATEELAVARQIAPSGARPYLDAATLLNEQGEHEKACTLLLQAITEVPTALPLIAMPLAVASLTGEQAHRTLQVLEQAYARSPGIDTLEALAYLASRSGTRARAADRWLHHLEQHASLLAVLHWLQASAGETPEQRYPTAVARALEHACAPLRRYRCAACGFEARQHYWQCPGCLTWDSFPMHRVEEL